MKDIKRKKIISRKVYNGVKVKLKQLTVYIIGGFFVVGSVLFAGSLTPSVSISTPNFLTFSDLYNKIIDNAYSTSTHSISTTTAPASSMYTLTQIWNAIPTISSSTILDNTTIMGITGSIAVKTGDNPATTTSTSTNKLLLTVPIGYYDGSITVSTTSTNFDPTNIASGVNLFGITGTLTAPLTWSASQGSFDWPTASSTCIALGAGWRLPTAAELVAALANQFLAGATGVPGSFVSGTEYWSGSPFDGLGSYKSVGTANNVVLYTEWNTNPIATRCVK